MGYRAAVLTGAEWLIWSPYRQQILQLGYAAALSFGPLGVLPMLCAAVMAAYFSSDVTSAAIVGASAAAAAAAVALVFVPSLLFAANVSLYYSIGFGGADITGGPLEIVGVLLLASAFGVLLTLPLPALIAGVGTAMMIDEVQLLVEEE